MRLARDGAQRFAAAFTAGQIDALDELLSALPRHVPGIRLRPDDSLAAAIQPASDVATSIAGTTTRPVRATLFDKTPTRNWALGWHQDRTIAVRDKLPTPGFNDWTVKHGLHHVVPPFAFLARMLTLRIHLDPAGPDNAPLLVAPGSHQLGRLPESDIAEAVSLLGATACLAARGDIWVYATPILHASDAAAVPIRRLVLQILYSPDDLPGGLEWLGV